MTYRSLLIDTCTIQEFTEGIADDYGHPIKTWTDLHSDVACRYVYGKGTEIRVGQEVLIIYDELYIEDLGVTSQDRVSFNCETYQILDVGSYQDGIGGHHKKLFIQKVD